ncbi:CHAP domain-containing protein, partial [Streptomyces roseochromogenus]|uniref:CHAP domain-containing protein n=1 Tax=Streptomyces roseochromogenus TaxID=285450 RepID=UPI0004CF0243
MSSFPRSRALLASAVATVVALGAGAGASYAATPVHHAAAAVHPSRSASTVVDGVALTVHGEDLPAAAFSATPAGTLVQAATATSNKPFRQIEITAVPYGHDTDGYQQLGIAAKGKAASWAAHLAALRRAAGGKTKAGPSAELFGRRVPGVATRISLAVDGTHRTPVDMVEWVVEAGNRIWIVRDERAATATRYRPTLSVTSATTARATTIKTPAKTRAAAPGHASGQLAGHVTAATSTTYGVPSFWSGNCDEGDYPNNFQLGNVTYEGIPACGPTHADRNGGSEPTESIGGWGEYQFECVELPMRYMYQAGYVSSAYSANGNEVVGNYPGSKLVAETNGTAGVSPQPGDVVSMNFSDTYGHTAIVTGNHVDSNGNGYIDILQQNWDDSGTGTMSVNNWVVSSENNWGSGVSWLHDPSSGSTTPPPVTLTHSVMADLNGDGKPDLVGIDSNDIMWMYPGTGVAGKFGARVQLYGGDTW